MAGIIAQLTRSARERGNKVTRHWILSNRCSDFSILQKYYGANKCLYTLERFDTNGFNPTLHNKFVVEREKQAQRQKDKTGNLFEFVIQGSIFHATLKGGKLNCSVVYYLQEEDQEMKQKKMFSWHSCIVETILILLLLGLIPGAVLTVEMIFSYGTQYIPDQCLKELYSNSLLCRPLQGPAWIWLVFIPEVVHLLDPQVTFCAK